MFTMIKESDTESLESEYEDIEQTSHGDPTRDADNTNINSEQELDYSPVRIAHEPTSPPEILEVTSEIEHETTHNQEPNDIANEDLKSAFENETTNAKVQGAYAQGHDIETEDLEIASQGTSKRTHEDTPMGEDENEDNPHNAPRREHPRYQLRPSPKTNYQPGFIYPSDYQAFQAIVNHSDVTENLSSHAYQLFHIANTKPMDVYCTILHVCFTQMSAEKGIRVFGQDAINALLKEFTQLNDQQV